ncbi:nuclear transport factor 2 family protein [Streptomyces sp. NPDC056716]|uniref:nuclear transport factor 2 family protein n=1 Tax=unclassified Streptomyces TaxID=2593676 RepID=UPI0036B194B5
MGETTASRDDIIAANLAAVQAHFHNEAPETIDKAIALYDENEISWEGPSRGVGLTEHGVVRSAYMDIFRTVKFNKSAVLREFATEQFVFHDEVVEAEVVGDFMPNLPYPVGTIMSVRVAHLFEMRDGKIIKEIAYEMFRKAGSPEDNDVFPEGTVWTYYN